MKLFIYLGLMIALAGIAHASCAFYVDSEDTTSFINEIPSINSNLAECRLHVPSFVQTIYREGDFLVNVIGTDRTTSFALTLENGEIVSLSSDTSEIIPEYTADISEEDFDAMLFSYDRISTFGRLYSEDRIKITSSNFFNKMKLLVAKPISGIVFK